MTAEAPAPIREAGSGRLAALDALRGVAALLVVVQHGGEQLWSGFRSFTGGAVQLGQLGVMAFFLVSGFVIPLSLERGRSLRRFVLTRVSRLYPAYWLSLLAVLAAWQAGRFQVPHPFGTDPAAWAVEATMLQAFSGVPNLQGQYWSLAFELIFYSIAAVLFVLRLHRRSVPLAVGALAVAAGAHLVGRLTGTTVPLGLANLATMFVGTVLWRVRSGQCRPATGWALYVAGALAVQLVLVLRLYGRTDASTGGTLTLRPMVAAWAGAYAAFAACYLAGDRRVPGWLAATGLVSYSVYLLHPVVMSVLGRVGGRPETFAVWVAATLLMAAGSYRLVEAPAVRAGRRAADRSGAGRPRVGRPGRWHVPPRVP